AFKSRAGMYPLDTAQTNFLGYHDELIIGWEIIDGLRWFKLAGSWGLGVGDRGFFRFPETYLGTAMISDMWAPGSELF
ncbi:MAG: hypothetical protein AAF546_00005, partial [Verrucomicrobiota bacterium]